MANLTWTGAVSGDFTVAGNWAGGVAPAGGEDLYFADNAVSVTAGLDAATAVNSINISKTFTGQIGTATAYLELKATTVNINTPAAFGSATGSNLIKLDLKDTASTVNIYDSQSSGSTTTNTPISIKGSAVTAINIMGGKVTLDTCTVTTLKLSKTTGSLEPYVYIMPTSTVATLIHMNGGSLLNQGGAIATANMYDGTFTNLSTSNATTINVFGGTFYHNGTGTITTLNVEGTVNVQDNRAKTITNCTVYGPNGCFYAPNRNVTLTNGIIVPTTDVDKVRIQLGTNVKLVPSYL